MSTPILALIPSGYKEGKLYSQLPINGDGDLTFARTTIANRVNEQGVIEEMGVNVPILDHSEGGCPPVLLQPSRKNLFFNSAVGVTQTITPVSGVDYAVSFSGTGSITFSGGASGTLNGTGSTASDRVSQIVTTSSTSVTCTISGTVEYVNFEINTDDSSVSYSTSWIETNGNIETRTQDTASKSGLSNYINSQEGVLYAEIKALSELGGNRYITLSDGTSANRIILRFQDTDRISTFIGNSNGGSDSFNYDNANISTQFNKVAIKWKQDEVSFWVNGSKIDGVALFNTFTDSTLNTLRFSNSAGTSSFFQGKVKDLRVYDIALTDQELTDLTS